MPKIYPDQLQELLARDLPGALATGSPIPQPNVAAHNGSGRSAGGEAKTSANQPMAALVVAEQIPAVARYLRETLGYQLLSTITAVDYLADGVIELVYHFLHLEGGPPLVVKTRVPRDQPVVPSITPDWPGANLQEREAFDLYGVQFPGHPNLLRIYMWDEFEGYPMRKDFPRQGDKYFVDGDEE